MTSSAIRFWGRAAGEAGLAAALLAGAGVAPLGPARLSLLPSLALGAVVGFALLVVLARRVPPSPRVERARIPLVAFKGAAIAMSSAAEEVLWRWFAIGSLAPVVGVALAYVASTLGFALAHSGRHAVLVHLVTGAGFGAVYVSTGSLAAAVAAHLGYNLSVLLAVESGRPTAAISTTAGGKP